MGDDLHGAAAAAVAGAVGAGARGRYLPAPARPSRSLVAVDTNNNGAIDPGEYGSLVLVKQAGKNAPQMSTFDGNRDGKLGFGEYVKLVQALAPKEPAKAAAQ